MTHVFTTAWAQSLGGSGRRLLGGALGALVLALVVALLPGPSTVPAHAEGPIIINPCFLDVNGNLICEGDDDPGACDPAEVGFLACQPVYPPPELLNPGVLASTESVNEYHALLATQYQAVDNVLADHQLPPSDRSAVLSWGRAEVEAEFVALVLTAARTDFGQRTADQQWLLRWLGRLVKAQAVGAAQRAGEEYARWAGLSRSTYWQKVGGTQDALADFLSGTPRPRADEATDVFDPRKSGYCDYKAPSPYGDEYDGSYLQTCFTPCSNLAGCPVPTPTYDQFVKWGQVGQYHLLTNPDFQMTTAQLAGIAAASGGAGTALGIGGTAAVFGAETVAQALFPMRGFDLFVAAARGAEGVRSAAHAIPASTEVFTSMAGTLSLVSAGLNMVAVVTTALYVGIYQLLTLLSAERLPLALASYVKQAQAAVYDPGTMIDTKEGASALLVTLVSQLLPSAQSNTGIRRITSSGELTAPVGDARCDNSLLTANDFLYRRGNPKIVDNPENPAEKLVLPIVPCLNTTPIPEPSASDPHFVVKRSDPAAGESAQFLSPTIDLVNDSAGYTSQVRVTGHWFVEHATVGDVAARWQGLRLKYTDWNGKLQSAYLYDDGSGAYRFVGTEVGADVDPDTCQASGACWSRPSIRYVGPDGKHYEALLDTESVGQPTIVTATPLSGAPVEFHANGFAPGSTVGEVTYQWRFQNDGCGVPCVTSDGVAAGEPPAPAYGNPVTGIRPKHTWRTAGRYSVEVTATDSEGRVAVTTIIAAIGGLPPKANLLPPCATGQTTNCTSSSATVGSPAAVMADVSHPGTMDNVFVVVEWGDGTSTELQHGPNVDDQNSVSASLVDLDANTMRLFASHTYSQPGYQPIRIVARDQEANTGVTQHLLPVSGPQTIAFDELPDRHYGSSRLVTAVGGGSFQPVTFTASPEGVCTSSGSRGEQITMVGVGECTVTANQAGSGIFQAAAPVSRSFEVKPADLFIRADNHHKTYGGPNPVFTARYEGLRNGDTREDLSDLVVTGPPEDAGVGSHDIVPSGATNPNYEVHYVNGRLEVRRAQLRITPDDQTRTYGSAKPAYTAEFDGLVNGDSADDITGLKLIGAEQKAPVGTYPIHAKDATNPNYDYVYEPGTETITPAPLTVTADDVTRTYGTGRVYTARYDGLVNGDEGLLLSFAGAPDRADVGEYAIVASATNHQNYDVTFVNGTDTVTPAPLNIKAQDKTRVYGGPSPAYTTVFDGLKYGDTRADITGLTVTGAPATAGVGTYPIMPSGGTSPNYEITFTNGTETVTSAPLTITADDKSKVYGAPDPDYTASYQGLVNGDEPSDIEGLQFVSPPSDSDVGVYGIAPSSASNPDYEIDFVSGRLTITPATLTIKADDKTAKFGTVATYTWRGQGWVNGDDDSTIGTAPTCRATIQGAAASVTTAPGAYLGAITCEGASDGNYEIDYASGGLTVNPVIRLSQTGLPSDVPHHAAIDGRVVSLPTGDVEVAFGSPHAYSFPGVVLGARGVAYVTTTPGFTGPVAANRFVEASYTTVTDVVAQAAASGGVDAKTASSLDKKWAGVTAGLQSGNDNRTIGALRDFADLVRSQSGKKISKPTADSLLACAQLVYTSVGGVGTL